MKDFFVSYNQADQHWAEWIAWHIEESGLAVILQSWDFRPGSNFALEMHSATQAAQRTIAVLSPDYLNAPFTLAEWAAAFAQDPTARQGKLLPVRVRACDPSGLLKQIIYIDLVGLAEEEAKTKLLNGISLVRAKPYAAPSFPGTRPIVEPSIAAVPKSDCTQILHLSDFQFGCTNDELLHIELLSSLTRDIPIGKGTTDRMDSVVISGDIVFSGKDQEYSLAEKLLTRFFADLNIAPSTNCFLVPGNHDVDWLSIGPADNYIIDQFTSEEDIARVFSHPPTMELLSSRLGRFYEFAGSLLGRARGWRRDRPWRVDVQQRSGLRIATIQLNSAWAVGPNRSRPMIGEFQVREALTEAEGADFRVWIVHHGFATLNQIERSRVLDLLSREPGVDFVYSGHLHSTATFARTSGTSQVYELSSGPIYPGWHDPSCSITRIWPATNTAEVQFFHFDKHRRTWTPAGAAHSLLLNTGLEVAGTPVIVHPMSRIDMTATQNRSTEDKRLVTKQPTVSSVTEVQLRQELSHKKSVLILTAVATELREVLNFLDPLPEKNAILRGHIGQETYYVGKYGAEAAIVTMCGTGAIGRDAIILATQQAVTAFNPIAIIMIGIAFGKDPETQDLGDVLVASQVISYEQQRIGGTQTVHRGTIAQTGPVLLNRFRQALDWHFEDMDGRQVHVSFGPLLSGEKLVDHKMFRDELFGAFPQAIGGEMEGAGLYAVAARTGTEWIMVKAICDWADGQKSDDSQPLAARAAASLVHHVLLDSTILEALKA